MNRGRPPRLLSAKKKAELGGREIICKCNNVPRCEIEQAVREGCQSLNEIFDATTAGVGPCGGSCRRKLGPLLDSFLETGEFPIEIKEDRSGKDE